MYRVCSVGVMVQLVVYSRGSGDIEWAVGVMVHLVEYIGGSVG